MIQIMASGTWIKRDMYNPTNFFFYNKLMDLLMTSNQKKIGIRSTCIWEILLKFKA